MAAARNPLLIAICFFLAACQGIVVYEAQSDYSHVKVIDYGTRRALYFVSESDIDVVETLIDLEQPHRLQHPYASTMMAGFLYFPEASSMLLVGLGGGALVRFLNHYFPGLQLDVIEIDPMVVRLAREFFGTAAGPRTRVFIADGRDHLEQTRERYDLILLDAHLPPGGRTDGTGHPLSLKNEAFYRILHQRLKPGGVVLFNMIEGRDSDAYIAGVRASFGASAVFRPPSSGNAVVVAKPAGPLPGDAELRARARAIDRRADYGFSFEQMLDQRQRE